MVRDDSSQFASLFFQADAAMPHELRQLLKTIPQVGEVDWIGLRPAKRQDVVSVPSAEISIEVGLIGDHFNGKPGSARQVTLIQAEHLVAMSNILKTETVAPELLRRNIVVSGINLLSLKDCLFSIGDAVLFGTGNCQPCSRMEEYLGAGGYNAMRGHGGITARVESGGSVEIGSEVRLIIPQETPDGN